MSSAGGRRGGAGSDPLTYEEVLGRLENVTPTACGHQAQCPLHDSKGGQNLSVREESGKTLLHCHAQECDFEEIMAALKHPQVSREKVYSKSGFEWVDLAGNVIAVHQHKGPWYAPLPNGKWVAKRPKNVTLYNLPEVVVAVGRGERVYIVEGEKDVETLRDKGLVATTSGGATSWGPGRATFLQGATVVIVPDNDDDGKRYAAQVWADVSKSASSIGCLALEGLEHKEDVTDWFNNHGGNPDRLAEIAENTLDSQFPFPKYRLGNGNEGVLTLSRFPRPKGSQPFLIDKIAPEGYPTVFYGDSGTLKTTVAAHLGLSVAAGREDWLGFTIRKQTTVLLIDFELDRDTMLRKLYDLAAGMGLPGLPESLKYLSGVAQPTKDAFKTALSFVEEHDVGLVIVDSLGIAMDGDMDGAKTVVDFMRNVMDEFRALKATSVLVDHQGKLQQHENYQFKTQYGNSFKKHLIRSQFQIEGKDGGLTVRHKKANFGPHIDPFGVSVNFEDEKITVTPADLTQAELSEEATVNISRRVLIALEDGPAFTDDLAERLNAEHKTVSNRTSDLVNTGKVEYTGRTENRYREVRLKRENTLNSQNPQTPKGTGIGNEENPYTYADKAQHTKSVPEPGNEAGNGECFPLFPLLEDVITSESLAQECIEWLGSVPSVALDIETYGKTKKDATSYLKGEIRLITFHYEGETRVVDLHGVSDAQAAEMLEAIKDTPKYLHNAGFDLPRLYRRTGVLLSENVYDTMLASRTARAGEWHGHGQKKTHDLGAVLERELGIEVDKDIDHKWGEPLTPGRLAYVVNDVLHLEELHKALERLLERRGLLERYEAVRVTLPTFLEATVRGVPVDRARLEGLSNHALLERDRLRVALDEGAPPHPDDGEWTWNDNKNDESQGNKNRGRNGSLRALEQVGVKLPNLQDQTLLDHRENHPVVAALQDYRKKKQEYSKYRKWLPEFYEEGRIYPQPKVAGAVTSRLLYSDPNIQGIEKHKTKEYRKVISPGAGGVVVSGDFAQQELRIAALISGDEEMIQTFVGCEDIYLKTASEMVGYEITDKEHPARAGAKRATLGFLYGLGEERYRENTYKDYGVALAPEEAHRDREAFRAAFPGFYKWQRRYGGRKEWDTYSILGWRRHVGPGTDRKGKRVPKYTDRLNGPIQSTAGDILYLAIAKMQEDWYPGARFLMGVHDEIVLEAPEESAREAALWLHAKMRDAFEEVLGPELGGPKSVEVGYGPSWGETTEVEVGYGPSWGETTEVEVS